MIMTDAYARFERLKFDRPASGVLRIRLSTPLKLNVMDAQSHRELSEIWRVVEADDSVLSILLTAEGEAFSAGGDLTRQKQVVESQELRVALMKEMHDLVYGMINCSKPIVSAARGWAVGAGLACVLLADISIAAKTARFSDGHTAIGIAAGDHSVLIWPLLCGMAKAKYYLMLAEKLTGEEAERIGLVSLAVDEAELDERALAIATRLADGSQTAMRWTKHALNNWLRQAGPLFDASMAFEVLGMGGADAKEGVDAFLNKRTPNYRR